MSQHDDRFHLLIVSHSYPTIFHSLSGIFWQQQARYFSKTGIKVGIIAIVPISALSFFKKSLFWKKEIKHTQGIDEYIICYPNIPFLHFLVSYVALWKGRSLFKAYLKKHGKPDIVHLHRYEAGLLALSIKNHYSIPVVLTEHSSRFLYRQLSAKERDIAKNVFAGVDYRMAVSPSLCKQLGTDFHVDFHYLPNTVNDHQFISDVSTKKESRFTFFSAGNLGKNKNHTLLIDAFRSFQIEFPDSQLIIAGDGPLKSKLLKKIKALGLLNKISLVGQLSPSEMIQWNNKSHVFVVSSIKETFSVVLIEAMSCGLPVISTSCGGPESIITKDFLGELTDHTIEGLLEAMKQVYLNYTTYSPAEIIKFVHENYSEEVILEKVMEIYKQLV